MLYPQPVGRLYCSRCSRHARSIVVTDDVVVLTDAVGPHHLSKGGASPYRDRGPAHPCWLNVTPALTHVMKLGSVARLLAILALGDDLLSIALLHASPAHGLLLMRDLSS